MAIASPWNIGRPVASALVVVQLNWKPPRGYGQLPVTYALPAASTAILRAPMSPTDVEYTSVEPSALSLTIRAPIVTYMLSALSMPIPNPASAAPTTSLPKPRYVEYVSTGSMT